jgi:hypothetical protein
MKNNQRGIVLSALIYTLFVFFLLIVASILFVLWSRQTAVDKIKDDANDIYINS